MSEEFLISILYVLLGLIILLTIRNNFVYHWRTKSTNAIYKYGIFQIENNTYDNRENNYEKMKISYTKHLFSFWLWGEMSSIKKEYQEILRPFFNN